jgi:hypothetical protein
MPHLSSQPVKTMDENSSTCHIHMHTRSAYTPKQVPLAVQEERLIKHSLQISPATNPFLPKSASRHNHFQLTATCAWQLHPPFACILYKFSDAGNLHAAHHLYAGMVIDPLNLKACHQTPKPHISQCPHAIVGNCVKKLSSRPGSTFTSLR